jgi:hypothetical protein
MGFGEMGHYMNKNLILWKINGVSLEVYSSQVLQTPIIKEYGLAHSSRFIHA